MFPKWVSRIQFFVLSLFLASTIAAQTKPTAANERLKNSEIRKTMAAKSLFDSISFRNIGPTLMSGRVVDIDANPDDPTEFFVAYASGGLWHTSNNGLSFKPVFDSEETITLGALAVNWKTGTIWLGTGEVNSSRSSYAGLGVYKSTDKGKTWQWLGLPESHHIGSIRLNPKNDDEAWVAVLGHLYSPNAERGVYKTSDGGKTWKKTLFIDDNTGAVDLAINPKNPAELYAATWYRTRRAWNFEEAGNGSAIYKSNDGGETWTLATPEGAGFPTGKNVGRIGITVFPGNPSIVYAVVDNQQAKPDTGKKEKKGYELNDFKDLDKEKFALLDSARLDSFLRDNRMYPRYNAEMVKAMVASEKIKPTALYQYLNVNTGFEGSPIGCEVYRSDDAGMHWNKANTKDLSLFFTYGYYFAKIYTSATDPDKVFILGFNAQMSTDGGKTFKPIDKRNVHADHHALWVNPKKDSYLINGNDGGVNITYDDGEVWFKANTPAVGQFYFITTDNEKPYNVYGGLQDNGVWYVPSSVQRRGNGGLGISNGTEVNIGGGDGMQVQVDPRDHNVVYYGSQFGNYVRRNLEGKGRPAYITPRHQLGESPYRFNWQSPILLSSHVPDILYFGSNHFHRSMNQGDSMTTLSTDLTKGGKDGNVPYGTLTAIAESPIRFGLLYVGSDDGNLAISRDAGYSWTQLENQNPGKKKSTGLDTRNLWVSRVTASKFSEGRVYVSLNGYRYDDFSPYLYLSEDFGNTWTAIGTDLPYEPINVVKEDPKNENIIYVGTDGGLYVSFDKGKTFMIWETGLPHSVPIHDIAIQERDNEIVLGTHGRSLYVASLADIQKLQEDPEWMKKKPRKVKKADEEDEDMALPEEEEREAI